MDFFSNKREKICVFFKSRGVNVALFLLYLILYTLIPQHYNLTLFISS